ncbi:MAG: 4Fe-4S binding protein [Planctomycetota bacterium]
MLDKLKQCVKELLKTKTVGCVLGYEMGDNPQIARPVAITTPDEVERLVWNEYCIPILAKYVLKPEVRCYGKTAVLAKPCDIRALVGLIQEKQIARTDLYIIAVDCSIVAKGDWSRCISCTDKKPAISDEIITAGDQSPVTGNRLDEIDQKIKELEAKPPKERWAFWKKEFGQCIRCYACRQICTLCYCRVCIADKNQPQWIPPTPDFKGNFSWNIIRAYHLAGRCIDCGECERACPVGIPLMLLNRKIQQIIKQKFDYEPGFNQEVPPPLATYHQDDQENFIL